ncbi:hypothetical protein [Nitrosomonas marina]|uniref:Uncharacterized protein n=1 Tax=Nitrosomonas marina TaxID=917 RepID=A0A1H8GHF2_9PROT|nr:hypothetical protein [Nitrosomonas marina]SEN43220.1 hypothetical protein SAMN05216325_11818 [Nitrosomonas marina]
MAKVLIPEVITDAMMTASSIAEPAASGEDAYNPATPYTAGATVSVIDTDQHDVFVAIQDTTGNAPVPLPGESAYWLHLYRRTNRFNMWELKTNYVTSGTSPVTYTLTPGVRFDSFALGGTTADFATLRVKDFASNIIFEETKETRRRPVVDYYDYFYMPFYDIPILIWEDIPGPSTGTIELELTGSGALDTQFACFGTSVYLGALQYDGLDDVENFSLIERRDTGEIVLLPKKSVPVNDIQLLVDREYLQSIRSARERLNAAVGIWYGVDQDVPDYHEPFLMRGLYREFKINAKPREAHIKLLLKGV